MRENLEKLLKAELRLLALKTRQEKGITQEKMSELLLMSESSYSDIETGHYMCGTMTTVLLLAENEAPQEILKEIKSKILKLHEEETLRV